MGKIFILRQPLFNSKILSAKNRKSIIKGALLPTTEILKEAEGGDLKIEDNLLALGVLKNE